MLPPPLSCACLPADQAAYFRRPDTAARYASPDAAAAASLRLRSASASSLPAAPSGVIATAPAGGLRTVGMVLAPGVPLPAPAMACGKGGSSGVQGQYRF